MRLWVLLLAVGCRRDPAPDAGWYCDSGKLPGPRPCYRACPAGKECMEQSVATCTRYQSVPVCFATPADCEGVRLETKIQGGELPGCQTVRPDDPTYLSR